ncbi:MAG: PAS domain-containing protein [Pseudomonadota bacterium]
MGSPQRSYPSFAKPGFGAMLKGLDLRTEQHRSVSPAEAGRVQLEKAALIYQGVPVAVLAGLVNALFALLVGWGIVNQTVLVIWGALVAITGLVRLALWVRVRNQRPTLAVMQRFKNRNMVAMAVNGALWGMLAPIFAVHGQIGHVFLPFILAGMSAAAIVTSGACWRCVLAFNMPALTPMAAAFFVWGGERSWMNTSAIMLYGLVTTYAAIRTSQMISRAIMLRSKNASLAEALAAKNEAADLEQKRFTALVEASSEITLIFSPEGLVTYASPSAARALGSTTQALLGQTTRHLMHEDDLEHFKAEGAKTLAVVGDVRPLSHVCLRHAGGTYLPFAGRLTNMLYVPGVEGFVFSGSAMEPSAASVLHAAQ